MLIRSPSEHPLPSGLMAQMDPPQTSRDDSHKGSLPIYCNNAYPSGLPMYSYSWPRLARMGEYARTVSFEGYLLWVLTRSRNHQFPAQRSIPVQGIIPFLRALMAQLDPPRPSRDEPYKGTLQIFCNHEYSSASPAFFTFRECLSRHTVTLMGISSATSHAIKSTSRLIADTHPCKVILSFSCWGWCYQSLPPHCRKSTCAAISIQLAV